MVHFQEFWKSVMANSELFGLLQVIMGEEGMANTVTNFASTGNQKKIYV